MTTKPFHTGGKSIRLWVVLSAVLAGLTYGVAAAQPSDLAVTAPTVDAVQAAARNITAVGCTNASCRAMLSIARVLQIELDAAGSVTMGLARPVPANRDTLAARAEGRVLLDHPSRFGVVCRVTTGLIAGYSRPGTDGDLFVAVNLLLLGFDMDRRGGGACLPHLLTALPRTEAADGAIGAARAACAARLHAPPACSTIGRS